MPPKRSPRRHDPHPQQLTRKQPSQCREHQPILRLPPQARHLPSQHATSCRSTTTSTSLVDQLPLRGTTSASITLSAAHRADKKHPDDHAELRSHTRAEGYRVPHGQNRQADFAQAKANHDFDVAEQELHENTEISRLIQQLTLEIHNHYVKRTPASPQPVDGRNGASPH
jgi:hypothetical protein